MSGKNRETIRSKLIRLLLIMGLLPLIIYIYLSFNEIKKISIEKTGVSLQRAASELAARIDLFIENKVRIISDLSESMSIIDLLKIASNEIDSGQPDKKNETEVDDILKIDSDFLGISVLDDKGKVLLLKFNSDDQDLQKEFLASCEDMQRVANDKACLENICFYENKMLLLADVTVPVREKRSIIGFIKVKINLKSLLYFSRSITERDVTTSLVTGSGEILHDSHNLIKEKKVEDNLVKRIMNRKNGWLKYSYSRTQKNEIIGFCEIDKLLFYDIGNKSYFILLSLEERNAINPIIRSYYQAFIMGIFIIIFIILAAYYDVRKISKPIEILTKSAELIGRGELDFDKEFKTGDEIEELCINFKKMCQNLKISKIQTEEQREKLENLNEVKSNFLSLVSHELRTPLMIIQESVSQILDGIKGSINEEQRDYLLMTKRNAQRLNKIIEDLLNVSKIESGKINFRRKKINISKIIINEMELYIYKAKERYIELTYQIPQKDIILYCDEEKMKIILDNLVSNAIKFTPDNGRIEVLLKDNMNEIEILVSDTGPGIPAEYHKKIFEKFERLNRKPLSGMPSSGLGLSIAKEFVLQHKGKIWVESDAGKGSVFHVVLPKYTENRYFKEYFEEKIKEADDKQIDLSLIILRLSTYEKVYVDAMQKRKIFSSLVNISFNNIFDYEEIIPLKNMDEIYAFLFTDHKGAELILERLNRLINDFLIQKKIKETFLVTIVPITYREDGADAKSLLKTAGRLLSYMEPLRKKSRKIGEILIESNLISSQDLHNALQKQEITGQLLGKILIDEKLLTVKEMADILNKQLNIPVFNKNKSTIDKKLFKILEKDFIIKNKCIPTEWKESILTLAMVNPFDIYTIKKIYKITDCQTIAIQIILDDDFNEVIKGI